MHFIPYGRQDIDDSDIAAVVEVLKSDFVTQGPAVRQFEDAVAKACNAAHGIAVSSATAGLHIAYQSLGVTQGSRVWTSPNTFVATANVALWLGATVDFVDIHADTLLMDTDALEQKLAGAKADGTLPDVVVPVHFSGMSCDMKRIAELGTQYGFRIVEDAAHAIGGRYDGGPIGDCRYSDACVFSFHPVKIITTGEGGLVTTKDSTLNDTMIRLRSHGITRDEAALQNTPDGPWYYEQLELGLNYRMTDIQAALGHSQLRKLSGYIEKRTALAAHYSEQLADLPLQLPVTPPHQSAWHLYVIQLNDPSKRRAVFESLRASNIGVNVHYIPVYTQPYYQQLGFKPGLCPIAEQAYARSISIPLYPTLSADEQDYVIACLHDCFSD